MHLVLSKIITSWRYSRAQSQNVFYSGFFHRILSFTKYCCLLKVIFHKRLSSIKGCLPSNVKVVFHQRESSTKGHLPSKVFFHQRASSIEGCLPSKVVSHQGLSFIKDYLFSSKSLLITRKILLAMGIFFLK